MKKRLLGSTPRRTYACRKLRDQIGERPHKHEVLPPDEAEDVGCDEEGAVHVAERLEPHAAADLQVNPLCGGQVKQRLKLFVPLGNVQGVLQRQLCRGKRDALSAVSKE